MLDDKIKLEILEKLKEALDSVIGDNIHDRLKKPDLEVVKVSGKAIDPEEMEEEMPEIHDIGEEPTLMDEDEEDELLKRFKRLKSQDME